ncbi:Anti-sigma-K factor rskA [Pigmentiphaga humi]|uniref:Anti-sigma-K factor rskA n=1 Tax=Pigmentiphaga humi TaxID=2478468 RepID=A0A3P4B817_9BURK|nr:anti-sigma factor [Pigmentiphaga humi]VCU71770.1 Anti-sigma-K factor rskA [Pigmentiphaga humi]
MALPDPLARDALSARPAHPWGWGGICLWRAIAAGLLVCMVLAACATLLFIRATIRTQILAALEDRDGNTALILVTAPYGNLRTRPLTDLHVLAGDKALELWALPAGGSPRSLGLLAPGGGLLKIEPGSLDGVPAVAVSLEPPGGSPNGRPSGPVILLGRTQQL